MVAFLAALLLPGAVPAASTTAALVVASPIAGLALGVSVLTGDAPAPGPAHFLPLPAPDRRGKAA
jgi:hypothetical protein